MYKYIGEVEKLIDEMIISYEINSSPFYKGRINNFFENYMSLKENNCKPLDALSYYDIDLY